MSKRKKIILVCAAADLEKIRSVSAEDGPVAQALYGVMARFCRLKQDYTVTCTGNFCCETPDAASKAPDYRLAIQGMAELLHIPKEAVPE